jgi:hypothetical protein
LGDDVGVMPPVAAVVVKDPFADHPVGRFGTVVPSKFWEYIDTFGRHSRGRKPYDGQEGISTMNANRWSLLLSIAALTISLVALVFAVQSDAARAWLGRATAWLGAPPPPPVPRLAPGRGPALPAWVPQIEPTEGPGAK